MVDLFCGRVLTAWPPRTWGWRCIGIDTSPKAVELVDMRLQQSMFDLFHNRLAITRGDTSKRTDIDTPAPYPRNNYILFNSERVGGHDDIEKLQLSCANCNRVKDVRAQEYLVARLLELGIAS